jgi:tetraacyldisaccharide 4'-kinase
LDDLRAAGWNGPLFRFSYAPPVLRRAADGQPVDPGRLADRRLLAFAGTARPQDFFASLERAGWTVAAAEAFPDHHFYTPSDLARLAQLAAEKGICYFAATEKDAVKLPPDFPSAAELLIAGAELAWDGDDGQRLMALIESRLASLAG